VIVDEYLLIHLQPVIIAAYPLRRMHPSPGDSLGRAQTNLAWDVLLPVEGPGPIHVRLTHALRDAITTGKIPIGSALPPSRQLAVDLSCSRWVVTEAFEQLVAEGYLVSKVGSGTRVRNFQAIPPDLLTNSLSDAEPPSFDLAPGIPDLSAFPRAAWSRAWRDMMRRIPDHELSYVPAGGHSRLRTVLAEYLRRARGASVRAENVTITSGILEGITQVCRMLVKSGRHHIVLEDPGWDRLSLGVRWAGLDVSTAAVDDDGIRTGELTLRPRQVVIVAPAHQFPTGVVLASNRRRELVEWAGATDSLILEDDYDAEFQYSRPVGTLQGFDPDRVALFGSLSKTLAPGLRIGWVVTPSAWTDALRSQYSWMAMPSVLEQLTLAHFIETGGYDRQLRTLRRRYRLRRERLIKAIARHLPGFHISGAPAGIHVVVHLPAGLDGARVAMAARPLGVRVLDIGRCRNEGRRKPNNALVLGFGNLDDGDVEIGIAQLAQAISTVGLNAPA
jgi:GntR family transcriptional regulator/MocR family aminotransferase